ncbi:MAG TPA: hypothetical protein VM677_01350 [Actinokineospora sp.]|jgi:hypothetical protein|nr:hypothetical protein [Actinokineospora sp.]
MPTRHDLTQALLDYRQYGWGAFSDEHGNIMIGVGEHFDVLTFHRPLAAAVADALPAAPLFLDARIGRCTLLTAIARRRADLAPALVEAQVRAVPRGTPLLLPLTGGFDDLVWLTPPTLHALPLWDVAIAVVGRAVGGWSR